MNFVCLRCVDVGSYMFKKIFTILVSDVDNGGDNACVGAEYLENIYTSLSILM